MWKAGSAIRTAQTALPQLPTPKLADSIPLLLASLEALAKSKEEFENTKKLLLDFANKDAIKLQELFEAQADACRTKVNEFMEVEKATPEKVKPTLHPDGTPFPNVHFLEAVWEDMAYLAWQDSISCFSNVFTTFFESTPYEEDPLLRAAWFTMGIIDFGRQILNGELQPEKGQCSAQYLKILFTTRLPGTERDRVVTKPVPIENVNATPVSGPYADRAELEAPHICVSTTKGHFYQIDITDISCQELYESLKFIKEDIERRPNPKCKLAALTGNKRDEWYRARVRLMASSTTSAASLRSLEEAVFHIVLSDLKPVGPQQTMKALQEGHGVWLDKSATMMFFANGVCGANLEHAAADAVVPARMLVHANDFAVQNEPRVLGKARDVFKGAARTTVRKLGFGEAFSGKKLMRGKAVCKYLPFDVDQPTVEDCKAAEKHLAEIFADNRVAVVTCTDVGSREIKKAGMAPDSFMQMALQLAYGLDQNTSMPPPTYETASTRAFLHGRTECIRSQSVASRKFVELYLSGKASNEELKKTLLEAANAHRNYLSRCSNGKGADRHMLMLRVMAMTNKLPVHPIYSDPLYVRGTSFELSTSQLPWAVYDHPGFGAPFANAYGCCYRFSENNIVANVASRPKSCPTKDAERFAKNIDKAIHELIRILMSSPNPAPQPKAKL